MLFRYYVTDNDGASTATDNQNPGQNPGQTPGQTTPVPDNGIDGGKCNLISTMTRTQPSEFLCD